MKRFLPVITLLAGCVLGCREPQPKDAAHKAPVRLRENRTWGVVSWDLRSPHLMQVRRQANYVVHARIVAKQLLDPGLQKKAGNDPEAADRTWADFVLTLSHLKTIKGSNFPVGQFEIVVNDAWHSFTSGPLPAFGPGESTWVLFFEDFAPRTLSYKRLAMLPGGTEYVDESMQFYEEQEVPSWHQLKGETYAATLEATSYSALVEKAKPMREWHGLFFWAEPRGEAGRWTFLLDQAYAIHDPSTNNPRPDRWLTFAPPERPDPHERRPRFTLSRIQCPSSSPVGAHGSFARRLAKSSLGEIYGIAWAGDDVRSEGPVTHLLLLRTPDGKWHLVHKGMLGRQCASWEGIGYSRSTEVEVTWLPGKHPPFRIDMCECIESSDENIGPLRVYTDSHLDGTLPMRQVTPTRYSLENGQCTVTGYSYTAKELDFQEIGRELLSNVVDGGERKVVYPWCRERHHSPDRAGGYTTWESLRLSSWLVQESRATC